MSFTRFESAEQAPRVFTASCDIAQPTTDTIEELDWRAKLFKENSITHILNVSDHTASPRHRAWYKDLGITYHEIPVADFINPPIGYFDTFLEKCVEWCQELPKNSSILIHCTAGINRSNAAAAAILWALQAQVDPEQSETPMNQPTVFLEWMAIQQVKQRGLKSFITNPSLRCAFLKKCRPKKRGNDNTSDTTPNKKQYDLRSTEERAFQAISREAAVTSLHTRYQDITKLVGKDTDLYNSLIREERILMYEHQEHPRNTERLGCPFCK